jgi:hypothetical protein
VSLPACSGSQACYRLNACRCISLLVPLFWSQSSTLTDMKPAPKLDRPVAQTIPTTRLHFDHLKQTYGPQVRGLTPYLS